MTSQINPSNIDGTYPVAGQDNNSQGFRTNFTNTSTNFQYAKNEITDLQNKAVLKTALTGTTLDNNMQGSPLSNALLSDMAEVVATLGTLTTTIAINYSAGPVQTVTLGSSCSLSFTGWPVFGQAGTVTVQVTVSNTAFTLTLPSAVGSGTSAKSLVGIQGLSGQVITFAQAGTYAFAFSTIDAGTTIAIEDLTRPKSYFTNNVSMLGNLSVAGTISGNISGNITVSGANTQVLFNDSGSANASANFTFNKATNALTLTGALSTVGNVVVTGNISAGNISGNILTSGLLSATGNVTGGNILTSGTISTTGNVTGGNILTAGLLSTTGNVTGGNILTAGLLSTTGNVTGGNILTAGLLSVTGNVTSSGLISATGNITSSGIALLNSTEDLVNAAAANLNVTTSYFTTAAAETATLAAGTAGQIKVFAATDTTLGNMVITVTNPAWSGAGTITFSAAGQACTLQYVNSKWFCIGNNGAAFA